MRRLEPPATATWLLEHFTLGERNEALAGDLLEGFRNGRTAGWYWSQVLVAIALGWAGACIARPSILAFGVLWSMLAPAWYVVTESKATQMSLTGLFSSLAFPWSLLVYLLCMLIVSLTFIWAGIGIYLLWQISLTGSVGKLRLGRALLLSAFVQLASIAVISTISAYLLPAGHPIDRNVLTPLSATFDLRMYATGSRLSTLATLLITLWAVMPRHRMHVRSTE